MPVSTDGAKLLARGTIVVLKDGVARRLILDMEALVVIEERTGSLSAYHSGLLLGSRGKVIKSVLAGLVGGLSHLEGKQALSAKQVSQLMVYDDIQAYINALDAAWTEAMPTTSVARGKGSGAASTSRGRKSTAASRSTTDAAIASSSG
jgi:hypothetical protein